MSEAAGGDRPAALAARVGAALERLGRARRIHRQGVATAHGLTPLQLDLLATLADGPPPLPYVGELAAELGVAQPTVTDSLNALVRKGLVRRRRDDADARRSLLTLTRGGDRVVAEILRRCRRRVCRRGPTRAGASCHARGAPHGPRRPRRCRHRHRRADLLHVPPPSPAWRRTSLRTPRLRAPVERAPRQLPRARARLSGDRCAHVHDSTGRARLRGSQVPLPRRLPCSRRS